MELAAGRKGRKWLLEVSRHWTSSRTAAGARAARCSGNEGRTRSSLVMGSQDRSQKVGPPDIATERTENH